jgi:ABC-2 type transport system permease protein
MRWKKITWRAAMSYQHQWLNSYGLMVKWQVLRLKPVLPLLIVVQALIGIGTVIGLSFLFPEIDPVAASFLVTGAPTLTLVALGLVFVPQMVASAKSEGTFDYIYALPLPRMVYLAADLTIWLAAVMPSVVLALLVGTLRYDVELHVSPLAIPAFVLIALMATMIGYAIVHIVFCLFLFSPINYPSERLPHWLSTLHAFLPIRYAADLVRGTLLDMYSDRVGLSFLVLGVWCLAGFGVTYLAMTRRQ